jgi:hypothetical protein
VYGGVDGDIHELGLSPGQGWADTDLTVAGGGTAAASAPFGYVSPDGPTARVAYIGVDGDVHQLSLSPGPDNGSGRGISRAIRAPLAPQSPSTDALPAVPSSGKDKDTYGLRLQSASTAGSDTRPAEALTAVFTGGDPAQGLSGQPAFLPLEGLDAFYELSAS